MRTTHVLPILLLSWALPVAEPLGAQEAEVREALLRTVATWNSGAHEEFRSYFMPNVHGFYLDGAMLYEGLNPIEEDRAAYAAGLKPNVAARQITIRVYGNTAVAAAYFSGSIALPGGQQLQGPWRYTETRIRDGGRWKIAQWHFSKLDPQP
jgi:ketosteroid isomerase-like protein